MLHVFPFEEEAWDVAVRRARATPIYDGSHRGSDANLVGALGEIVFEAWLRRERLSFHFDSETPTTTWLGQGSAWR